MQDEHINSLNPARPEQLPKPTYWPFFSAMGIAFIGWGMLSFFLFSIIGLLVFIISLIGWINELRHEAREGRNG